uniref:Uncharacterized protein n=1 Tax=Physcomitrium patens TaxID=3218 RepID=A0A7I3ZI03_PHYPA
RRGDGVGVNLEFRDGSCCDCVCLSSGEWCCPAFFKATGGCLPLFFFDECLTPLPVSGSRSEEISRKLLSR